MGEDCRKALPGHLLCYPPDRLLSSHLRELIHDSLGDKGYHPHSKDGETETRRDLSKVPRSQKLVGSRSSAPNPKRLRTLGEGLFHYAQLPQIDPKQNFPPNLGGASPKLPGRRKVSS